MCERVRSRIEAELAARFCSRSQLDFASMEGSTGASVPSLSSPCPVQPTEPVCARTVCLDWWANSGLPCRYSKAALYTLSKTGNIPLLTWWLRSRFPLSFDKEVLTIATRFGQTRVLQWWLESGVEIEYRFFDIEEAIEDCVGDRDAVTRWWEERGYNARMGANQWMRMRKLE